MTEDEAKARVEQIVGAAALDRLATLAERVRVENERQNLVASSTLPAIWRRHILDSIQLIPLGSSDGVWVDIGTGGGFPGLAIAVATDRPIMLVEPRRKRADFLAAVSTEMGLGHVDVAQRKVEAISGATYETLSARAVMPIGGLFDSAAHLTTESSRWVLPRGAGWREDVETAKTAWRAMFHVEHSATDSDSRIVVASGVKRR